MTGKKKIIDEKLKGMIKRFQKIEPASSSINAQGQIEKRKYNPITRDDERESIDLLRLNIEERGPSPTTKYGDKISAIGERLEESSYDYRYRKPKPKSKKTKIKTKRCRCK